MFTKDIENKVDPYVAESGLFAARSVLDALDLNDQSSKFMQNVYTSIIQNPFTMTHKVLAKSSVVFIQESSTFIRAYPTLISAILPLLLQLGSLYPDIQSIVFKTIYELCLQCKDVFSDNEFNGLYTYLEHNYLTLPSDSVGMLMEAVCTVCSVLPSEKLPEAVSKTSRIAV